MKTVLFLCGGRSDEHEISLISAKCILDALDRGRFTPIVVGIAKSGTWHFHDEKTFFEGEFRADKIRLNTHAPTATIAPYLAPSGRGRLDVEGRVVEFDAVFPILHGQYGEDGTLQGLLDLIGVPYVGSGCGASWIGMDKHLSKNLSRLGGVPVADWVTLASPGEIAKHEREIAALGYPLFVKPSRQGSSVGVSKVTSPAELTKAVEAALKFDTRCLVEKGIKGREIECAVLGLNRSPRASLPGEIVPSKKIGWYSYEAKYLLADGAETLTPAPLEASKTAEVQALAIKIFTLLECDGLARVDLFLEDGTGKLYLNEVNTLPGFTPISMYPKMWEVSGIPYPALITELIDLAFRRLGREH